MANALEEQILAIIAQKLATITTDNGYQTNVVNVYRASTGADPAPQAIPSEDRPAVQLRCLPIGNRVHIRGAIEMRIPIEIICVVDQDADALSKLVADVKKLLLANKRWNNGSADLARRTWLEDSLPHETEVAESDSSAAVLATIIARADQTDPTAVKAI